jgi:hypothetical protein
MYIRKHRLDMLLLQDVSINDVNEVVKKVRIIFKHTSASVFRSKCKKSFCEKTKAGNKLGSVLDFSLIIFPVLS